MAERWFLKLDGIAGESTDERHRGEIDVTAWSFGVSHPGSGPAGAGAGRGGRPVFDELHVEAPLSIATPPLFAACASGRHLRTAVLTGARGGAPRLEFVTYSLEDVLVVAVHHGDTVEGVPTDAVALGFKRIRISYRPQLPDGAAGAAVTAGWDVVANSSL
jgi:type VI secretion system secreted protein Hcp